MTEELSPRARKIRAVMHEFIQQRLEVKLEAPLKKLEKNQELDRKHLEAVQRGEAAVDYSAQQKRREDRLKIEQAIEKREAEYAPAAWLSNAAARVSQIQVVTHPIKATFPDAKLKEVSSLYVEPLKLPDTSYVTSRALGQDFDQDVTGNAAALDVNAFLNERYEDRTVGSLIRAGDVDVLMALDRNEATAKELASSFRGITKARTPRVASASGVKQLFWLAGDEPRDNAQYCVLSPLYPSHLSHSIFQRIQAHRFGEDSKEARAARRGEKAYEGELTEYPSLAVLKIGGANPQNISQLMSARRGVNYMLSSLPPVWNAAKTRPLWGYPTLFRGFERREETRRLVGKLEAFLVSDPPANLQTRTRISRYIEQLVDALIAFARPYQELETEWTADDRCKLPLEERLWLNPYRALIDDSFYSQWLMDTWPDELGKGFARWLNGKLRKKLPVGDVEHRRWRDEFDIGEEWRSMVESARNEREATEAKA